MRRRLSSYVHDLGMVTKGWPPAVALLQHFDLAPGLSPKHGSGPHFCLSVEPKGGDYLPRIFGRSGHVITASISSLVRCSVWFARSSGGEVRVSIPFNPRRSGSPTGHTVLL